MFDFSQYAPQQGFLMQGDETVFERLVAELVAIDPLVQALSMPRFTIEHARDVASFAIEGTGEQRTFVIFFSFFSSEAAQVLLKSLEEPASQTTIVFVTRYPYLVPQTVRSRLMLLSHDTYDQTKKTTKKIIETIVKESAEKDDDAAVRRSRAIALLDDLELSVRDSALSSRAVYEAKEMLLRANLPTKFVLDYVATVIRP